MMPEPIDLLSELVVVLSLLLMSEDVSRFRVDAFEGPGTPTMIEVRRKDSGIQLTSSAFGVAMLTRKGDTVEIARVGATTDLHSMDAPAELVRTMREALRSKRARWTHRRNQCETIASGEVRYVTCLRYLLVMHGAVGAVEDQTESH